MDGAAGNLIGGEWRPGDRTQPNVNPARPYEVIGHYTLGSADDVAEAAAAARAAAPGWAATTIQARSDLLSRISLAIAARVDELGTLLAREEGKTLAEAKAEVTRASQIFGFFAGEALRLSGDAIASVRPGVSVSVTAVRLVQT